ncbi:hypothetical protein AWP96_17470 [Escherichia coli]|nr:hypothetical protein AWP96_17470 [Escherichia coli]
MLPSETMIWQPEFTDKTLSRKPGAVQIGRNHLSFILTLNYQKYRIYYEVMACVDWHCTLFHSYSM